jgi:hypothetical protein
LDRHACIDYARIRTSEFWQFDSECGGGRPVSVMVPSGIVANNFEASEYGDRWIRLALLHKFAAAEPIGEGR